MNKLQMNAYHYCFIETGVVEVDKILSAVARAGKSFHHTSDWIDPFIEYKGKEISYIDFIQEMGNECAAMIKKIKKQHRSTAVKRN